MRWRAILASCVFGMTHLWSKIRKNPDVNFWDPDTATKQTTGKRGVINGVVNRPLWCERRISSAMHAARMSCNSVL